LDKYYLNETMKNCKYLHKLYEKHGTVKKVEKTRNAKTSSSVLPGGYYLQQSLFLRANCKSSAHKVQN